MVVIDGANGIVKTSQMKNTSSSILARRKIIAEVSINYNYVARCLMFLTTALLVPKNLAKWMVCIQQKPLLGQGVQPMNRVRL